ncbi:MULTISPECIES: hypothetical protein [unclassified Streptomyces]|uniref:hypothetical protein n=1 Tax=unclassified Streptomyces TaxID=2593676 RepID=UPI000747673E|nr:MULTISPECIES: hypothetical protein [unclassified Streptomyces]KUL60051.1 hypothetical protein ADL30_08920 [Streptomyces sp. NRRL S-1521]THC49029.1 hypothetical protein E7X58_22665 [Streptomyces sp. A1499]
MTDLAKKRAAQLGQQLQADQLGAVRRQAEGWRNGLAGLTGLVGAVFVLKGRESVAGMPDVWRWTTAALLAAAFLLLLSGALKAVRAAHGQVGEHTWLSGDRLFAAVLDEVERTQDALASARRRSVTGLCAIVAALAVSWVVPVGADEGKKADEPAPGVPRVLVTTQKGAHCGRLVVGDGGGVTIERSKDPGRKDPGRGPGRLRIPAAEVISVTPVGRC